AAPGRAVARAVGGHQQDAGDELDSKNEYERAAPDIAPFRPAGNVLDQEHFEQPAITRAVVEPGAEPTQPGLLSWHDSNRRGGGSLGVRTKSGNVGIVLACLDTHALTTFSSLPCSKFWYLPRMSSPTLSHSRRSMPRGTGPSIWPPFGSKVPPWHGQRKCPSLASKLTEQPKCGQIAVNASTDPSLCLTSQTRPISSLGCSVQASRRTSRITT